MPKKTVTRQRRGCDLNPGASAPESNTLATRLPSHPPIRGLAALWTIVRRIIDTAHIVCGAGSMHLSGVCPSVCLCPFVRLPVCPVRPPHAADAGLLPRARRPGDIHRLLHGVSSSSRAAARRAAANHAGSATLSSDVVSRTQTCSVFSRWQLKQWRNYNFCPSPRQTFRNNK